MVNQPHGVLNRVNRQGDVGWTNSLDNKSGVLIPYPFSMNPILCSGQHVHYFTVDKRVKVLWVPWQLGSLQLFAAQHTDTTAGNILPASCL